VFGVLCSEDSKWYSSVREDRMCYILPGKRRTWVVEEAVTMDFVSSTESMALLGSLRPWSLN
jgi:hypothetical protein